MDFRVCLLLGFLLVVVDCTASRSKRTINIQAGYLRWSTPGAIPYYLDTAYTMEEQLQIAAAIRTIISDMRSCIGFTYTAPTAPVFKVKITPFAEDGKTLEQYCSSAPGFDQAKQTAGKTEQRLVLARGPNGCFTGKNRDLMKYFAILLGKRFEHDRGDRNDYIDVSQTALVNDANSIYRPFTAQEAYWSAFPYDYCSITHNQPAENGRPAAFTVKKAPFFIPALSRLSNTDCQLISMLYPSQCDRKKCEPLDCAAQVNTVSASNATSTPGSSTAASTTGPTTTAQTSSQTACPTVTTAATATTTAGPTIPPFVKSTCTDGDFSIFCKKAPTASLLYQAGATTDDDVYVLISGNCAMTYTLGEKPFPSDPTKSVMAVEPVLTVNQTANPVDLSLLFPGYDALGQTLPINFAFTASNNGPTFLSNSANPTKAAACSYPPTQPATPCFQATWPAPPLDGSLSTAAPTASSTTVLAKDQFIVYHNSTKQMCRSTTGQPTQANQPLCFTLTKELDPIVKVTAIQYMNDPTGPLVLVFGEDATAAHYIAMGDGQTVGFSFDTSGGAFPTSTYTNRMKC